jgi:hypothetical protein
MLLHTKTSNITINSYKPRWAMETVDTAAYAITTEPTQEYGHIREVSSAPKCNMLVAETPRMVQTMLLVYITTVTFILNARLLQV